MNPSCGVGSFRALLATTTTKAIARFTSPDPLVRIDGVQVAASFWTLANNNTQNLGNTALAQRGFQGGSSYGLITGGTCNAPKPIYCVEE